MLELAILIVLAGKIGRIIERKGRKKIGYQLMLIGMWIAGEVFGLFLGIILGVLMEFENPALLSIVCALSCAALASVGAFSIAKSLAPVVGEKPLFQTLDYVDRLGASEHFGDRRASSPASDGCKDSGEKAQRSPEDRIRG